MTTKGRTRYREPNMAQPPRSTTPTNIMAWEERTWVDRVASLDNFRDHVQGRHPVPPQPAAGPLHVHDLMYNIHYTLSTTNHHAPTDTWLIHSTNSLLPADYTPPPAQPGPRHVHQGGRA